MTSAESPPATARSTTSPNNNNATAANGGAAVPLPPLLDSEDILHPSYVRLSTMPAAPRPVMLSRQYIRPNLLVPGPGAYFKELTWTRGTAKIYAESAGNPKKAERTLDVPYYDIKLPGATGFKMGGRLKDLTGNSRKAVPGPGQYDLAATEMSHKTQKDKDLGPAGEHCSFGSPHRSKRPNDFPGPGAYDLIQLGKIDRNPRGAVLTSRCPPLKASLVPGPGSYDAPSAFTPRKPEDRSQRIGITLKGRLPYAGNDKLALHDCARSDHFHDPSRKFRAAPRLK